MFGKLLNECGLYTNICKPRLAHLKLPNDNFNTVKKYLPEMCQNAVGDEFHFLLDVDIQ
jgi:hypothetical protein